MTISKERWRERFVMNRWRTHPSVSRSFPPRPSYSTESLDRRETRLACQTIAFLGRRVIVVQEERRSEWLRCEEDSWTFPLQSDAEDCLKFPGQKSWITLAEIYEGIDFTWAAKPAPGHPICESRPVESPKRSSFTPTRSRRLRKRLLMGVSSPAREC